MDLDTINLRSKEEKFVTFVYSQYVNLSLLEIRGCSGGIFQAEKTSWHILLKIQTQQVAYSALSLVHLLLFNPTFTLMQICHQLPVSPLQNPSINHPQISLLHSKITLYTPSLWIYIAVLLRISAQFLLEILNAWLFFKNWKSESLPSLSKNV